jgi:multiple sugar transport system ATP-binding protein
VGTPQTLYDTPANRFVAGFIGSPSMNFIDVTLQGTGADAKLVGAGDFSVPMPPRLRESVAALAGRKIIAGVRPEHLELNDAGPDSAKFSGRADVVEYLGNEELIHVTAAGQDIVAIVDSSHHVKPGDELTMALPLSKLHLFDAESGISLVSEKAVAAAVA